MKTIKRLTMAVVIVALSASVIQAQFRNTKWGMSKQDVKSAESKKLLREQANSLTYQDQMAGLSMYIQYVFPPDRDKLARAQYFLGEDHQDKTAYIDDYKALKKKLTQQYGEPHTDTLVWKNSQYKGKENQYGKALANGDMNYIAQWDLPETSLRVQMWGDRSGEIQLIAQFTSKKFGALLQ